MADTFVAVKSYRLVRNIPLERYRLGHPEPFAPLFDVEEIDHWRMPVRVIACGIGAEAARRAIAAADGAEVV